MRSAVQWRLCWENDLQLTDHVELSDFFRKIYGRIGSFDAKPFEGGRSWAGARPEVRLIASDAQGIAAHVGILRRFIKVGEVDFLVAELGLYGVRPDLEKLGISFSMRMVHPVLQQLAVPFAFGTVRHAMRSHVERFCREGIAAIVPGVKVRSSRANVHHDLPSTRLEDVIVLVSPIGRSIDEWPPGDVIDRNGSEL
uniref:Nodulation protein A n=1 Tax=Mesorhizobium sp. (strain 7653R) TaxID=103761 RepID=NODA_MESS7|nr:RecName: Full=Nodulation protein A [Mesorhizobium sp. 7653R]CAB56292.1 NodA protein [Mesorhizobium sp. 7653R]